MIRLGWLLEAELRVRWRTLPRALDSEMEVGLLPELLIGDGDFSLLFCLPVL